MISICVWTIFGFPGQDHNEQNKLKKNNSDRYHYEYQKEWFHRINSEKDLSYSTIYDIKFNKLYRISINWEKKREVAPRCHHLNDETHHAFISIRYRTILA